MTAELPGPVDISVTLPTRDRLADLRRSVDSLLDLAHSPERVQILYGVDSDDEDTIDMAGELVRSGVDWISGFPERHGYANLHLYVNELVTHAVGDWIMFWNDDSFMQTKNWDKVIRQHSGQDLILWLQTTSLAEMLLFPIVPRRFVERVGHFSLSPHNDTWWSDIGGWLGINRLINVLADHRVASSYHDSAFYSPSQYALRAADADDIGRLIRGETQE